MTQDTQLLNLAFAYAGAVGKLSGTMKVLIDYGHTYTEQEKVQMMEEALKEADQAIANAK
jgi:hypothetical protein